MKSYKSKRGNTIMWIMILFLFAGQLITSLNVNAASKANKAKKAYRTYLSNIYNKKECKSFKKMPDNYGSIDFITVDMSGDKIPELIVRETYTEPEKYYIYTYKNGKVKKLKTISYFTGGKIIYLFPSKHVVVALEGDSWDAHKVYYKITGTKMKKIKSCNLSGAKGYTIDNGKYKLKKNTAKNRKKM